MPSPESTTHVHRFASLDHAGYDIFGRPRKEGSRPSTPRKDAFKNILAGRKKEEICMQELDEEKSGKPATAKNVARSGSSRFKTWLKKKTVPDRRPLQFEIVIDIDEERCPVGREVKVIEESRIIQRSAEKQLNQGATSTQTPLDPTLRGHLIVLIVASRDLGSIEDCMTTVRHLLIHLTPLNAN
jgi:hypothetical protein